MEDNIRNILYKKKFTNIIVFILLVSAVIFFVFYFIKVYQSPEERENQAIKSGLMKMLGGKIVEINSDQRSFVVDIDSLGKHKLYTIYTNEKTNFSAQLYSIPEKEEGNLFPGENQVPLSKPEQKSVDFNYLKAEMNTQIYFSKRIDVDKAQILTAESVSIIEQRVLKNE